MLGQGFAYSEWSWGPGPVRQFEFGAESPQCRLELQLGYEVPLQRCDAESGQQMLAAAGSMLHAAAAPSLAAVAPSLVAVSEGHEVETERGLVVGHTRAVHQLAAAESAAHCYLVE